MTDYLMIRLNKYSYRWNEKFFAVLRMRGEKIEKKKNMWFIILTVSRPVHLIFCLDNWVTY